MKINGKNYKEVDLNFNTVCKLEAMGVSLNGLEDNVLSTARAYAALCMKKPLEYAGAEIEAHVIAGGSLNELLEIFSRKVDESGFFQGMRKRAEAEATEEAEEMTAEA